MCVSISATIVKVVSKVLQVLLGDKKGRKFLGYVVGIVLFIVLLPLIAVYGLFGWMSGGDAFELVGPDVLYQNLPTEYLEQMEQYNAELSQIEITFSENGLSDTDISKAKTIYLSCLTGKESVEGFYQTYADCFLNQSGESDLLTNISAAFGITFSEVDRQKLNQIYGGS